MTSLCSQCQTPLPDDARFCPRCGTATTPPPSEASPRDPLLGTTIGERYKIIERIGEGASGSIYRAEHQKLGRKVAIKILHHQLSRDLQAIERFRREATTVSRMESEHILQVVDFGDLADGRLFFSMELLEGETLAAVLKRDGTIGIPRTVDILSQVAEALVEAHSLGYIHRDLRPRNIFLTSRRNRADFVKLLDFALAKSLEPERTNTKQTAFGIVFGAPTYQSPEQARGDVLDRRSDLYSLGVIAYEMLTGHPPYEGASPMDVLQKHIEAPIPEAKQERNDCPDWLSAVVTKLLQKDPHDRFVTAFQLLESLKNAAAPISASEKQKRERYVDAGATAVIPKVVGKTLPPDQSERNDPTSETAKKWFDEKVDERDRERENNFYSQEISEEEEPAKNRANWLIFGIAGVLLLLGGIIVVVALASRPRGTANASSDKAAPDSGMIQPSAKLAAPPAAPKSEPAPQPPKPEPKPVVVPATSTAAPARANLDTFLPHKTVDRPTTKTTAPAATTKLPDYKDPFDGTARDRGSQATYFIKLGRQKINSGDLENAAAQFRKALTIDSRSADAFGGLGEIAFESGDYVQAVIQLKQATKLAPNRARFFILLGQAYYKMGRFKEATVEYRKALKLDPNNTEAKRSLELAEKKAS